MSDIVHSGKDNQEWDSVWHPAKTIGAGTGALMGASAGTVGLAAGGTAVAIGAIPLAVVGGAIGFAGIALIEGISWIIEEEETPKGDINPPQWVSNPKPEETGDEAWARYFKDNPPKPKKKPHYHWLKR